MAASKSTSSTGKKSDKLYRTVQCRLCADESTRKLLWELMERHPLLVNLLLEKVGHSKDFEQWRQQGWVPEEAVEQFCNALKKEKQFKGLPSRFYMSAISLVKDTFDGWVKSQRQLSGRINGKKRWLKLVQDDVELAKTTGFDFEMILNRAKEVLLELHQQKSSRPHSGESDLPNPDLQEDEVSDTSLFSLLFDTYEVMEDALSRRAIVHLLKNEAKVNEVAEDPEKLELRLATKRKQIQRLEDQLTSRLPKGRDTTGERSSSFLQEATQLPVCPSCYPVLFLFDIFHDYVSQPDPYVQYVIYLLQTILSELKVIESEFLVWQAAMPERLANAAKILNSLPYPLLFGSADDLYWSFQQREKEPQQLGSGESGESCKSRKRPSKRKRKKLKTRSEERICVRFKGLGNYTFRIDCDRRQLPLFRTFATDWQTCKQSDEAEIPSSTFCALRSAKLLWKEDEQSLHKRKEKAETNLESATVASEHGIVPPWETHRLYFHCSFDPDLLTAEGIERVQPKKVSETKKTLDKARKKEQKLLVQISKAGAKKKQTLMNELTGKRTKILSYETSLIRLNNPLPRPSKVPYEGEANIAVGISFCLQELVGVAVVDLRSQQLLEYYSARKLLRNQEVNKARRGRSICQLTLEKYRLVNRLRKLSKRNLTRREEQKQGKYFESKKESNLGEYLQRLIAARITQVALKHRASSIVIPDLGDMHEYIESAIQAKAEQLFPNHREQQRNYAKQFRIQGHRWSYKMLAKCIRSRVLSEGISVKTGRQPITGGLASKAFNTTLSGYSLA